MEFGGEWAKTTRGEDFLLASQNNIHIFATEGNLQLLAQSEELYVDGTFHIAPRLFYQVFTIHVLKHGQQFPWHTVYKGSREVLG